MRAEHPHHASHARQDVGHGLAKFQCPRCRDDALRGPQQTTGAAIARAHDALNAGYRYLVVKCLGCNTHQTVPLDIVRRPKATSVHELERYMRCKDCSEVRGYPYKRSHLVALRPNKISASDPPSTWWPGER